MPKSRNVSTSPPRRLSKKPRNEEISWGSSFKHSHLGASSSRHRLSTPIESPFKRASTLHHEGNNPTTARHQSRDPLVTKSEHNSTLNPRYTIPKKMSYPHQIRELQENLHSLSLNRKKVTSISASHSNINRIQPETSFRQSRRDGRSKKIAFEACNSSGFGDTLIETSTNTSLSPIQYPEPSDRYDGSIPLLILKRRAAIKARARETPRIFAGHHRSPIVIDDYSSDSEKGSIIVISSDSSSEESTKSDTEDGGNDERESQLADILDRLSNHITPIFQMHRLPFLRRNLRKAMDLYRPPETQHLKHSLRNIPPNQIARVRCTWGEQTLILPSSLHEGNWWCAICQIIKFNTRKGLLLHISGIHKNCEAKLETNESGYAFLEISVPELPESDSESDVGSKVDDEDKESCLSDIIDPKSPTPESPSLDYELENQTLLDISIYNNKSLLPSSTPGIGITPTTPELPKVKQLIIKRPPKPIDPSDPDRYPTPPPYDDLEGPAAVYPYISPGTYSARPGGPKIYDLLNELSLEKFGIMDWLIIDQEEDLFELDNVRDEDKMMRALWNRWIFLNRNKFIEDYGEGIITFIDEYWRMIHRGAGYSALQVWLLVLVQNRFLTGSQYCLALKHYAELVGMNLWRPQEDHLMHT